MPEISLIIEKIAEIVQQEVNANYKLFLFGSRAKNIYDERADIDIGILPDNSLSPRQMLSIREKIDKLPTLLKIDFVDFNTVSDDFRSVALERTKEISI